MGKSFSLESLMTYIRPVITKKKFLFFVMTEN